MEKRWVSSVILKAILAELAKDGQLIAPVKIGDEGSFPKGQRCGADLP